MDRLNPLTAWGHLVVSSPAQTQPTNCTSLAWAVQGLVQETQSPDKSGQYKGPTDEDRSQLSSVTVLVHKRHREEVSRMHKNQSPCTMEALARTNGVMKLTNMVKNLRVPDANQLTAHGPQPHTGKSAHCKNWTTTRT